MIKNLTLIAASIFLLSSCNKNDEGVFYADVDYNSWGFTYYTDSWDVDMDGEGDVAFQRKVSVHTYYDNLLGQWVDEYYYNLVAYPFYDDNANVEFAVNDSNCALLFSFEENYDPKSLKWSTDIKIASDSSNACNPTYNWDSPYVVFRKTINGNVHYGWVTLYFIVNEGVRVDEWAFNRKKEQIVIPGKVKA